MLDDKEAQSMATFLSQPTGNTLPDDQAMQMADDLAGKKTLPQDKWGQFISSASKLAKARNYPLSVLAGQAALESGYGSAAPGNNFFGIKGSGTAGSNNLPTQEYGSGGYYSEDSNFAANASPEDSITQYLDLIQKDPRYSWAYDQYTQDHDPVQLLANIRKSGYATSPTYINNVMNTQPFQQYASEGN